MTIIIDNIDIVYIVIFGIIGNLLLNGG